MFNWLMMIRLWSIFGWRLFRVFVVEWININGSLPTPQIQGGELGDNEVQWPVSLPYSPMMGWSTRAQPRWYFRAKTHPFLGGQSWHESRQSRGLCPKTWSGYGWDMVGIPSGKRLHNYGKSPCLLGKSTISTGPWLQ
jgi:hypothetical protein